MNFDKYNVELTLEEVLFAARIFNSVYTNQAPIPDFFGKEPPDDGESHLVLSNIPINRANVALMDAFKDDRQKASALGFRLMSLSDFLQDSRALKWMKKETDHVELHENIFAALAKYKITENDAVNKENFFNELKKIESSAVAA